MKANFIASALALALLGAPSASAEDIVKLAVGQRGNWDTSVSEIGQRAGIFKRHGLVLELVYTQGAGETQQAVISGSVDLGIAAGVMGVLSAFAKGAPVRVIAAETTGAGDLYWYVKADSPIKTLKDTDGKTLAYSTNGSSTHGVVTALTKEYGLKARPTAMGGPVRARSARQRRYPPHCDRQRCIGVQGTDRPAEYRQCELPQGAQGDRRALHEGLPRDRRLHVPGPGSAEDLFGVARHHGRESQAHARRLLSAARDRAGQDRRAGYDREGRG
jgi:hypothetical protein